MNNPPPLREAIPSTAWDNWFQQISDALKGFRRSMSATVTRDFGSIVAQSQASLTASVTGAQPGNTVLVSPSADVSGIIFSGVVTGLDVVTIYAKNFTSGTIDPPSLSFQITVIQR